MIKFSSERVEQLFDRITECRIAVIGDLMLDRYVWGRVERISPEAPVPVVRLEGESQNLGGAANVASNVGTLGASAYLFGIVGNDSHGEKVRDLVGRSRYGDNGVLTDPSRPTSVKTRVIAQNQHLIRIDQEELSDISDQVADDLAERFIRLLRNFDSVILEDYNKGVLTSRFIRKIIAECKKEGIPVGVDPKWNNFWEYESATLLKPNLKELESAVGRALKTDEELSTAGFEVMERLGLTYLLVTLGERGMALFADGKVNMIPTRARRVHDVSGAGDTVIATVMTVLAGGGDIYEAATLGTYAASVVIAEVGAVPIDRDDLRRACLGHS